MSGGTGNDEGAEALRESEARFRLLYDVGEAMSTLTNPQQTLLGVLRLLGEHLGASRCAFAEVEPEHDRFVVPYDYTRGCATMAGEYRLTRWFLPQTLTLLREGHPVVVPDVSALPAEAQARFAGIQVKALVMCGLVRDGALRALMAVHQTEPRAWTERDVALIQTVFGRGWVTVEQKAAEARLRQSEALLRIAGRVARVGGWSIELATERVVWTDEVCDIHDMPSGTTLTMEEAAVFYPPESRALLSTKHLACIEHGTPYDVELAILTRTGRRVWARAIGHPERDATGAVVRIQGALQDLSDRRQLEEQLRQAQKMEAVGQLAGGVAHDFNNLLSVILGYTSVLVAELAPEEPLRADLLQIQKAGERAAELTRQLLAFSRAQILEPKVLDLNQVVQGLEKMLGRLLGEQLTLSLLTTKPVGQVRADPGQLEQVLMNLVVNARDAMPEGGRLTIETANVELDAVYVESHHGVSPGRYVMLAVTDTGTGMDAETRAHLFEPFYTTKEQGRGTGLGLSTVYGIVKQSGGHLWVYSEPGTGSVFKVYLPRVDDELDKELVELPREGPVRGNETILLVEDEEMLRSIVREVLVRNGYEVLDAQNAGEALLLAEQHGDRIDLLLTDVVMPRMSGKALAERLASTRPAMKVVFMSGYTENTIVHHGVLDAGIEFLPKPVTPEVLLRKVRAVLDAR